MAIKEFTQKQITARVPAKLILSGEHAVVYGKPALAMAVDRFIETTLTAIVEDVVTFNSDTTTQLVQYAFNYLVEQFGVKIDTGLAFKIISTIPIGCGMGSSAAAILSVLCTLDNFFDLKLTPEQYLTFGRTIENRQHGVSSGLDLYLGIHGGCFLFEEGIGNKRALPNLPLQLINTGIPSSTTGECVASVAKYFKDGSLADDFAEVTLTLDHCLAQQNLPAVKECIKENHRLLQYIGVVPKKVAEFINKIERSGGAAKISGAGAVSGDNAGMVMVFGDVDIGGVMNIHGEPNGMRII